MTPCLQGQSERGVRGLPKLFGDPLPVSELVLFTISKNRHISPQFLPLPMSSITPSLASPNTQQSEVNVTPPPSGDQPPRDFRFWLIILSIALSLFIAAIELVSYPCKTTPSDLIYGITRLEYPQPSPSSLLSSMDRNSFGSALRIHSLQQHFYP